MNIQKVSNTNFNGATIIKTKQAKLLNILDDVDFHIFRNSPKPKCKYEHVATSTPDKDSFWKGIFVDGEDVKKNMYDVEQKAKTVIISDEEELMALPFLLQSKDLILKLLNS